MAMMVLIGAPASGQGKTTVTAGIARAFVQQGKRVRVFKAGPDFIDPFWLTNASDAPVYQLDTWMVGEEGCQALLADAAQVADVILVEGVMGLHDGTPSSADLACLLDLPVLLLIDACAMAQTFGALVYGLANYDTRLNCVGVIANRVNSDGHAQLLIDSLRGDVRWMGRVASDPDMVLPERHLGLVMFDQHQETTQKLDCIARQVSLHLELALPSVVPLAVSQLKPEKYLHGIRIGIARDAAFCFLYQANLDLLCAMGAELVFFSPCQGDRLPNIDSVYLPGGYPELHLSVLEKNVLLKQDLHAHVNAGKPLLAECGGLLYLCSSLQFMAGSIGHHMAGIIIATAVVHESLTAIGSQQGAFPNGILRGHTFHHASIQWHEHPTRHAQGRTGNKGEAILERQRLTASFVHWYFPSCPQAAAALFLPSNALIHQNISTSTTE